MRRLWKGEGPPKALDNLLTNQHESYMLHALALAEIALRSSLQCNNGTKQ